MAQFAVHLGSGLLWKKVKKLDNYYFTYSIVVGSILPDFDFIPLMVVYLFDSSFAKTLHRSFSHSLFLPLLLLLFSSVFYFHRRSIQIGRVLSGLSIGITSHIILDILFWFDSVNILWPLNMFGYQTTVSLWSKLIIPDAINSLAGPALEFLAYAALYFYYLRLADKNHKNRPITLRYLILVCCVFFIVFVPIAFILPTTQFKEIVYGMNAVLFAPLCMVTTWKNRRLFFSKEQLFEFSNQKIISD